MNNRERQDRYPLYPLEGKTFELMAACSFGLESVVRREIEALGYEVLKTEDGRVTFLGDARAIVRANLWLRTCDRVQLKMGEFDAVESEDLFQNVKKIPWETVIPEDGKFTVLVRTVKSKLRSEPNNQKTVKKAIVERMRKTYPVDQFPETGASYTVHLQLLKDHAVLSVNTTGNSLHKRGYREAAVAAPLKETMAAAMVELSFWHPERMLIDPCAGSGTIAIEAAMIGRNIAPGIHRSFASEEWNFIPESIWKEERKKAYQAIDFDTPLSILAADIDPEACEAIRVNSEAAGIAEDIQIAEGDIRETLALSKKKGGPDFPGRGVIIMNPPYGERIGGGMEIRHIYDVLQAFLEKRPDWSLFLLTNDRKLETKGIRRQADRRRKLYNGRLCVTYYQFAGNQRRKP
ncbi:MAG: class I SAM-dependent RNA methyltransferase [Eubacteriales bacterium]|nr:class I SAM-dependent RNA methyltransferase [Eubacteriales bacterium]